MTGCPAPGAPLSRVVAAASTGRTMVRRGVYASNPALSPTAPAPYAYPQLHVCIYSLHNISLFSRLPFRDVRRNYIMLFLHSRSTFGQAGTLLASQFDSRYSTDKHEVLYFHSSCSCLGGLRNVSRLLSHTKLKHTSHTCNMFRATLNMLQVKTQIKYIYYFHVK